ncbi:tRNA epoxyqueuosine(34) reductase QueG [Thiomicrorhabdus sp. ZW0627]|uniref:tRNA epoxyqueuosine(34) reductase QueG n=1 Tax=Thiomicrorhabdus sp. ZW0627 TaxID=3039774 RepID=UPI0024372B87|nr:tRNA epoxyqueuosine(34) reductase QueG [Thiomicrorhabdus sp. ZW0627]MDG6773235.1 tRNA epoxyqueuosine(34) reductase QueG [Thiomicrorhabdus sp. ZW0627]
MQPYLSKPLSLAQKIKQWGLELGFADVGISDTDLSDYEARYFNWIGENFHGEMEYMARHGTKRTRPEELEPGTLTVISVRLNYLDLEANSPFQQLHDSEQAYVSRYALGKDYHKLMRKRLQQLAEKIHSEVPDFSYRAFCDSAPVLERPLAQKAGLGFIGKNSLIIHPRAGSWFFLGELYTNLPLQPDPAFDKQGCGPCTACIDECPTGAILDDAVVDARKCISYLTIEYDGSIPEALRDKIGNRIYGCDDCQLVCPWNKFTTSTQEEAFQPKADLDSSSLLELWKWDEKQFLKNFEGSPIRRIGYNQWKRNLAVALGNMQSDSDNLEIAETALRSEIGQISPLVDEHIQWALNAIAKNKLQQKPNRPVGFSETKTGFNFKPFKAPKYYLPKPKS